MGKIIPTLSKRSLQIVLGGLWLLDGALQLQPKMFTSDFITQVIDPAMHGKPVFVSGPMHFAAHMFLMHPIIFNGLIVVLQLGLGMLILWKKTTRWGLIGSVVYSLGVWSIGEGYGGILSGHTTLLMGAPGAALLYALLALALLPRNSQPLADDYNLSEPQAYWLTFVWFIVWVGGAIYQLLPTQNSVSGLTAMLLGNAAGGAPGWLAGLDIHAAHLVSSFGAVHVNLGGHMSGMYMAQASGAQVSGYWLVLSLAAVMFCIGWGVFFSRVRSMAVALGIIISVIFWVVGQSFGGYYSGVATDPNTAPLLVLLGIGVMSCKELAPALSTLNPRLKKLLVG